MKKKIAIARGIMILSLVLLLLLLFFPVKAHLDDGGSVVYASITGVYKVTKIKRYGNVGKTLTMREGLSIELFGKEVYYKIDKEYPLDEKGVTLHQGFVPSESREGFDGSDTWMMYTETPYSSLLLVDGEATAKMLLEKTEEAYPTDTLAEEILTAVKEEKYVVLEDLRLTSGGELWQEFYQKVQEEEHAQIRLVHYFAPDDAGDDPRLYFYSLVYVAGEGFWIVQRSCDEKTEEREVYQYLYLIHNTREPIRFGADYSLEDIYFLANDNTVTWDEIQREALSSYYDGDRIEYYMVYNDFME